MNPAESGGFSLGVVSCVQNDDPDNNPLYVHWLIPGPDGWAPKGFHLESGTRFRSDGQVQQLNGCLQYGNRGDMTQALFLSVDGDQTKIDDEAARGCRSAAASVGEAKTGTISRIVTFIRNFFPSDSKNAAKTMLWFEGTIGVEPTGPDAYRSFVQYAIGRFQDSDGSIEGISIEPEFRGPVEALLRDFRSDNHESTSLMLEPKGKGTISFQVKGIKNPSLSYGTYAIRDRTGQRVGSIDFPLFVSGK